MLTLLLSLLGSYSGNGCHLTIAANEISFNDDMGDRTLWNTGHALRTQVSQGKGTLVFDHARSSLMDMTIHLEIRLENGRPVAYDVAGHGMFGGTALTCTLN
jgi:hypothetical protein